MAKPFPLTDFRAVRSKLEPHDFALGDGEDPPPSDLVEKEIWDGIIHLPEDVSIRISDHNGTRLKLLYSLWSDWITAVGDPDHPDEIFNTMLDVTDCYQCATFNFLHGYYRAALAECRTALELMMIGTYGALNPGDKDYLAWKAGTGDLTFGRCRKRLLGTLTKRQAKWMFEEGGLLAKFYQKFCSFTHSRPDASDSALWQSNGPVYNAEAIKLTFFSALSVYAINYLLVRLARPFFNIPEDSDILFELDWMPEYPVLVRACTELYGKPPKSPLKDD
jgi:hypothetical protein